MKTWKVTLEFDGTRYHGWQEQRNARSVMGALREVIEPSLGAAVELMGAGRTDSGVHALGQVMHVKLHPNDRRASFPPNAKLLRDWNDRLPSDIAILAIEDAHPRFHARHDATARSYVYQIATRKSAFLKRHVWWIKDPLHLAAIQHATQLLPGRHDFVRFAAHDPARPHESTIVVLHSAEADEQDHLLSIRLEASHFLWRMVRRIVGVLVKIGAGQVTLQQFEQLLQGQPAPHLDVAAWTAPASGLFLESVTYPEKPAR
jgi:tRNA pseudouridine38-40 synthase